MSYFNARNYGKACKMWVYFSTKPAKIHHGYDYKGEFHYEDDGKYFTMPIVQCSPVGE